MTATSSLSITDRCAKFRKRPTRESIWLYSREEEVSGLIEATHCNDGLSHIVILADDGLSAEVRARGGRRWDYRIETLVVDGDLPFIFSDERAWEVFAQKYDVLCTYGPMTYLRALVSCVEHQHYPSGTHGTIRPAIHGSTPAV